MRVMLAMLLVALAASGCGTACGCVATPSPFVTPSGAMSKDAAIEAAIAAAPPSTSTVTSSWAHVGVDPFAHSSTGPLVWMVIVRGSFALPTCRPDRNFDTEPLQRGEPPCSWKDWDGLTAVLDLFSGELIGWTGP
jgi:hypothetical protein